MGIRRVVTGHDAAGNAVFASDEVVEPVTVDLLPQTEFYRIWGADAPLRFPDAGGEKRAAPAPAKSGCGCATATPGGLSGALVSNFAPRRRGRRPFSQETPRS